MNFTCPYCNHHTTITSPNQDTEWRLIGISEAQLDYKHRLGMRYTAVACPNAKCKKLVFAVFLTKASKEPYTSNWIDSGTIRTWDLLPETSAKPQPDYIPKAVIEDYNEACRIVKLSPKSSATLARRSLQGMIRDFWGISKGRLVDEINALKDKINTDTWEAIDAIRSVGNIGAHMEKDVNVIVEIEPQEAELLIELIEDLFVEWYVTRHDRQERTEKLKKLAADKAAAKKH